MRVLISSVSFSYILSVLSRDRKELASTNEVAQLSMKKLPFLSFFFFLLFKFVFHSLPSTLNNTEDFGYVLQMTANLFVFTRHEMLPLYICCSMNIGRITKLLLFFCCLPRDVRDGFRRRSFYSSHYVRDRSPHKRDSPFFRESPGSRRDSPHSRSGSSVSSRSYSPERSKAYPFHQHSRSMSSLHKRNISSQQGNAGLMMRTG